MQTEYKLKEEFRDIEGYEGLYQASNLGNIKTLNYRRTGKHKLLLKSLDKRGYERLMLRKDGKSRIMFVHRLVMYAFEGYLPLEVNHIDKNPRNNKLENLEYCTSEFNKLHQRDC